MSSQRIIRKFFLRFYILFALAMPPKTAWGDQSPTAPAAVPSPAAATELVLASVESEHTRQETEHGRLEATPPPHTAWEDFARQTSPPAAPPTVLAVVPTASEQAQLETEPSQAKRDAQSETASQRGTLVALRLWQVVAFLLLLLAFALGVWSQVGQQCVTVSQPRDQLDDATETTSQAIFIEPNLSNSSKQDLEEDVSLTAEEALVQDLPYIVQTRPISGAVAVPLATHLEFTFSTQVQCTEPLKATVSERSTGQPAPIHAELDDTNRTLKLQLGLLASGTTYVASLGAGACTSAQGTESLGSRIEFTTLSNADVTLVTMNMSFQGLDFDKFVADDLLVSQLRDKVIQEAVLASGLSSAEHIRVDFTNGSVIASLTILPDSESALQTVEGNLQIASGNTTLQLTLLEFLKTANFSNVIDGELAVVVSGPAQVSLRRTRPQLITQLSRVSLDAVVELQFSETVQRGTGPIALLHVHDNEFHLAEAQPSITIDGVLRLHLPSANLRPASQYAILLGPSAVMSLEGQGNAREVRQITTEGPVAGTWRCALAANCTIRAALVVPDGSDPRRSQILVAQRGFCRASRFKHPESRSVFANWTSAAFYEASKAEYELGVAFSGAGSYELCWRSGSAAAFAVPFGELLLTGPSSCEASCIRGRTCEVGVSGFQIPDGALSVYRAISDTSATASGNGGCDLHSPLIEVPLPTDDANKTSVPIAPEALLNQLGNMVLCWRPMRDAGNPRRMPCGSLTVSGPHRVTGAQGGQLDPAASTIFQLHISGSGLALTDSLYLGKDCQSTWNFTEPDEPNVTLNKSDPASSPVMLSSPLTGFTGSRKTSLRWTVPGLPQGSYAACWQCLRCEQPVLVGSFSVRRARCGDGRREAAEGCDDGNTRGEDGCDARCQPEAGFDCQAGSGPDVCREVRNAMTAVSRFSVGGTSMSPASNLAFGLPWLLSSMEGSFLAEFERVHELRSLRFALLLANYTDQHVDVHVECSSSDSVTAWHSIAHASLSQRPNASTAQDLLSSLAFAATAATPRFQDGHWLFVPSEPPHCGSLRVSLQLRGVPGPRGNWTLHKVNWNCGEEARAQPSPSLTSCQELCHDMAFAALWSAPGSASNCRCYTSCNGGSPTTSWQTVVYHSIPDTSGPVLPWGVREVVVLAVVQDLNCTQAPDCNALHRTPCSEGNANHLCGACLDNYAGEVAPSVAPCSRQPVRECLTNDWADWSSCSRTCGIGWLTRSRLITQYPDEGADDCPALEERRRCNLARCDSLAPFCASGVAENASESTPSPPLRRLSSRSRSRRSRFSISPQTHPTPQSSRRLQDEVYLERLMDQMRQTATSLPREVARSTDQVCDISQEGTASWKKVSDDNLPEQGLQGCPGKFYLKYMRAQCISTGSNAQCSSASDGLDPGCYMVYCCEPCAKDCQQCLGPRAKDCILCISGKLLYTHADGRRECIKSDTCAKLGCHRPTADGRCERDTKRWDCDTDEATSPSEMDEDSCAQVASVPKEPRLCPEEPSTVCAFDGSSKLCFYDAKCSDEVGPSTLQIGCGAGGFPNCRWCGFEDYGKCPEVTLARRLARSAGSRRRRAGAQNERNAKKFLAAKSINKLKRHGAAKIMEMASPHIEAFLREKIRNPLVEMLKSSIQHTFSQTILSIPSSFAQAVQKLIPAVFPSTQLPDTEQFHSQLQQHIEMHFRQALEKHRDSLFAAASSLIPATNLAGDSEEIARVRSVYSRVQSRSVPLMEASVSTALRSVLRQAGASAASWLTTRAQATQLVSEAWEGLRSVSTEESMSEVASEVAETVRKTLYAELSRTLEVEVLSIINQELLVVEQSAQDEVRTAVHSLLPGAFGEESAEQRLHRVVNHSTQTLQQRSAALLQASVRSATQASASGASASLAKPVEDLLMAATNSLSGMLRTGAVSLGNLFGIDVADKFDEVMEPLQRQVQLFIHQLLSGSASALASSITSGLEDMVRESVEKIGSVIATEVQSLVTDLQKHAKNEAKKALGRKGANIFKALMRAAKSSIKQLPKQIKKRQILSKVWSTAKAEIRSITTRLKGVLRNAVAAVKTAAGQAVRDLKQALSTAGQDGAIQLMMYLAARVVSATLSPLILQPVDAILQSELLNDALQAVSARLSETAGGLGVVPDLSSLTQADIDPELLVASGLDRALSDLEGRSQAAQHLLENLPQPQDLVTELRSCIGSKSESMEAEVSNILVQIASSFAFGHLQKHFTGTHKEILQRHASKAPVDFRGAVSSVALVLRHNLETCVEGLISAELVKYSAQAWAAARVAVETCTAIPPVLHLKFERVKQELTRDGMFTTGNLLVWNMSSNTQLMSLEFVEAGWSSRLPAGDYAATVQPKTAGTCGTQALALEMVPGRTDPWIACGTLVKQAGNDSILVAERVQFQSPLATVIGSQNALSGVLELALQHPGEVLVSIQDEPKNSPDWSQSTEEQFFRLAFGAYASQTADASEKTHAAQGWALLLDLCGESYCAYVSAQGSRCVIAFGGPVEVTEWAGEGSFQDMESVLLGSKQRPARFSTTGSFVHAGALEIFEDIKRAPSWEQWRLLSGSSGRCHEVYFVGHGLGGAAAVLHGLDHPWPMLVRLRTYGAPRLFNASVTSGLGCASWRYWLQDGGCEDPISHLPTALQHGPANSVPLVRNGPLSPLSGGCNRTTSSPPEPLRSQCRGLHLPEMYLAAFHNFEATCEEESRGQVLLLTAVYVNENRGASVIFPGDTLRVAWKACKVPTVKISVISAVSSDSSAGRPTEVVQWLADARAKEFSVLWATGFLQSGAGARYRIQLKAVDRTAWAGLAASGSGTVASRWFQAPHSKCSMSGAAVGLDTDFSLRFTQEVSGILRSQAEEYLVRKLEETLGPLLPVPVASLLAMASGSSDSAETLFVALNSREKLGELVRLVPVVMRRGHPVYSELKLVAGIFGLDLVAVIKQLLLQALSVMGAPEQARAAVDSWEPRDEELDELLRLIRSLRSPGHPTFNDLDLLARILGLGPAEDLILGLAKNVLLAALGPVLPESIRDKVQQADIRAEHVELLREAVASFRQPWQPSLEDLSRLAEALNLKLADLLLPLLAIFLEASQVPSAPLYEKIATEEALASALQDEEVQVALTLTLQRGYPSYSDLQALAAFFGLDLLGDLVKPFFSSALRKSGLSPEVIEAMEAAEADARPRALREAADAVMRERRLSYRSMRLCISAFGLEAHLAAFLKPAVLEVLSAVIGELPSGLRQAISAGIEGSDMELAYQAYQALDAMIERGLPNASELLHLASALGLEPLRLLTPLLAHFLSAAGVPSDMLDAIHAHGTLASETMRQLQSRFDAVMARKCADLDDLTAIAEIFGLQQPDDLLLKMISRVLQTLGASSKQVEVIRDISITAEAVQAINNIICSLPTIPTYEAVKGAIQALGLELHEFLRPLLRAALMQLGLSVLYSALGDAEPEPQKLGGALDLVQEAMSGGPMNVPELAEAFGLQLEALLKPLLVSLLQARAPEELVIAVEQADDLGPLQVLLPAILERNLTLRSSDLQNLAETYGLNADHVLKHLAVWMLRVVGAPPDTVEALEQSALPAEADRSKLRNALDAVLRRGYPNHVDLQEIAEQLGLQDLLQRVLDRFFGETAAATLVSRLQDLQSRRSSFQELSQALPAVQERGYPTVSDAAILADALGFDAAWAEQLLKPLLVKALEALGVPAGVTSLVQQLDAPTELIAVLESIARRGYPSEPEWNELAASLNVSAEDLMKPWLEEVFVKLASSRSLLSLPSQTVAALQLSEPILPLLPPLFELVPGLLRRGYPTLADLDALAAAFGIDLAEDVVKPVLVAALRKAGAPADLSQKVEAATMEPEDLESLAETVEGIFHRGLTVSDLVSIAEVCGVDAAEEILKPTLEALVSRAGVPEEVLAQLRAAQLQVHLLENITWLTTGQPSPSDFLALADAFGLKWQDLLAPALVASLQAAGLPDNVTKLLESENSFGDMPPEQIFELGQLLAGRPTLGNLASLAEILGLQLPSMILPLFCTALRKAGLPAEATSSLQSALASLELQDLLEAQALATRLLRRGGLSSFLDVEHLMELARRAGYDLDFALDLARPFAYTALRSAGATEAHLALMQDVDMQMVEDLRQVFSRIWHSGSASFADLRVLAAAFGLDTSLPVLLAAGLKEAGLAAGTAAALAEVLAAAQLPHQAAAFVGNLSQIAEGEGGLEFEDLDLLGRSVGLSAETLLNASLASILETVGLPSLAQEVQHQPLQRDAFSEILPALKSSLKGSLGLEDFRSLSQIWDVERMLKPLAAAALSRAGASPELLQRVWATNLTEDALKLSRLSENLQPLLPVDAQPTGDNVSIIPAPFQLPFRFLEAVADAFGLKLVEDVLSPLLAALLQQAGCSNVAHVLPAVLESLEQEQLTKLHDLLSGLEATFSNSDAQSLAELLNLTQSGLQREVLVPMIRTLLAQFGMPATMVGEMERRLVRASVSQTADALQALRQLEPSALSVDRLDLKSLADVFGLSVWQDVALPLLAEYLRQAGLQPHLVAAVRRASVAEQEHENLALAAEELLSRGRLHVL